MSNTIKNRTESLPHNISMVVRARMSKQAVCEREEQTLQVSITYSPLSTKLKDAIDIRPQAKRSIAHPWVASDEVSTYLQLP